MHCSYTLPMLLLVLFFFFNDTATTEIYTLSLHDALPIYIPVPSRAERAQAGGRPFGEIARQPIFIAAVANGVIGYRSEEHTSELQSHLNLVCRLLLEKKKNKKHTATLNDAVTAYYH